MLFTILSFLKLLAFSMNINETVKLDKCKIDNLCIYERKSFKMEFISIQACF